MTGKAVRGIRHAAATLRALRRGFAALVVFGAIAAAAAIILADSASPLAVTNVDSPDPVSSGSELTYTYTIVNTGGAAVSKVVLSTQINGVAGIGVPPELVLTSTRGACTLVNATHLTCDAGIIEGRGVWVVTVRGIVTAANGTTLNNTVSVTATKSAQNFTSTATATTLVNNTTGGEHADLSVTKAGPTTVGTSAPMTYTVTVNNTGNLNAMNVKVVDTVPAGLTGITAAGTSLFTCGVVGQTVTCTGGAVNQGSNATITINATSPATAGSITNTAVVDPDDTIEELNELNNTSALVDTLVTDAPPPPLPYLTIDKTDKDLLPEAWDDGAGPDPLSPGSQITYKILVRNNAPYFADDVVVVDGTQGLQAASIQVSQVITDGAIGTFGGCVVTAPETRCSIRRLQAGGTMVVTVIGQVVASAGSTIFNTATVTGNIKNTGYSATDSEITTVKPRTDLTITKVGTPNPVCAASWPTGPVPAPLSPPLLGPPVCLGGLTYDFVIGNSGLEDANNVVLRDPLPPGVMFDSFVDVDAAGFVCAKDAANVVTCAGGLVPAESTKKVRFVLVAPPAVGPITNVVTVDPNNAIFEADESNNVASYVTQVGTGVDLTLKKFDNGADAVPPVALPGFDPIATSGTQTYTIQVDNIGTQDAANIHVRDTLPAGTIFRSAQGTNNFTCSHAGGVVDCIGGIIRGTASETYLADPDSPDLAVITIRVFAQPIVGTMHNEVRVDPFNLIPEANETNNIAFQDTTVQAGGGTIGAFNQFTIDKTQVSPDATNTARNAVVTYKIEVKNDGTDPAVGVFVRDFIPTGSRYIEATGTNHFLCTALQGFIDCAGGEIGPGVTAVITLKVFAPDTPGTYNNQAIVDPLNAIPEGNEFDNQDTQETIVKNGGAGAFNDLTIEKTGDDKVKPNESINYTLTITNSGSDPALDVAVRDMLPAGTTFVSAQDGVPGVPGAFTCNHGGGVVNCTGATINGAGGSRTIKIEVTAPNQLVPAPGLINQAFVDPDNTVPEGDEENNTDTFNTIVATVINLHITKSGPSHSSQSQVTDYVITVTNKELVAGEGEGAANVVMFDPLPVGLIPLAVDTGSGNNWQCQIAENPINVVTCTGDLTPAQEVKITITVFMTAESGRSLDNEACVDPDDVIKEFDENDNCSTHTLGVGQKPTFAPDLLVSKNADKTVASEGDTLVYTILVANAGTAKAKSPLKLTDELPSSVTIVGTPVTTNGWTCDITALPVITCADPGSGLDVGEFAQITINTTVNAGVTTPFANTAKADPALVDPGTSDELLDESNTDNNESTVTTGVSNAPFDLSIVSITDTPDPATQGKPVKYTVVAANGGSLPAPAALVRITLPNPGAMFIGADGTNGFNCAAPVGTTVDCVGDLPAGGNTTITVNLAVTLAPPGDLTLTATIDPLNAFTDETDEGNNTQNEVTTVSGEVCIACVDLVATQLTAAPDPASAGSSTVFTFVIVNAGDMPTTFNPTTQNLAFFDVFATGPATFAAVTSSNPAAVSCTAVATNANSVLNDCTGNLAPGEGVILKLTASALTAGSITAFGTLDPGGVIAEFKENNNLASNSVIVQ